MAWKPVAQAIKGVKKLAPYISDTAEIVDAELFDGSVGAEELKAWVDSLL